MQDSPVMEGQPPLSQIARVVDTFIAPTKTFTDILRSASWWLPCILVMVLGGLAVSYSVKKIGAAEIGAQTLRHMPSLAEKIDSMPPDQAAQVRASFEKRSKSNIYSIPITLLISGFIAAGIFMMANFLFGGSATYSRMLAVFWYSLLPLLVMDIVIMILLAANVGTENYNPLNPVGTNIGYFVEGASPALSAFLNALDLFSIWIFALQVLGVAKAAKIKIASSVIFVGIVWVIYIAVVKVLPMMLFG